MKMTDDRFGFHMCYRICVRTMDGKFQCKRVDDLYEAGVREFLVPCTDGKWHEATLSRIPFPKGQKMFYVDMYGTKGIVGTGNIPCFTTRGFVPASKLKARKSLVRVNKDPIRMSVEKKDTDGAFGRLVGLMLPEGEIEGDTLIAMTSGQTNEAVNYFRVALSAIGAEAEVKSENAYTRTKVWVKSPELVEAIGRYLKGDHHEVFELTDEFSVFSDTFVWSLILGLKSTVASLYQSIRIPSLEAAYIVFSLAAIGGHDLVWNQDAEKSSARKGHENERYSAELIRFDESSQLARESELHGDGRYVKVENNVEVDGLHEFVYEVAVEGEVPFVTPTGVVVCSAKEGA